MANKFLAILALVAVTTVMGCGPDKSTTVSAPPAADQANPDPSVYQSDQSYYQK